MSVQHIRGGREKRLSAGGRSTWSGAGLLVLSWALLSCSDVTRPDREVLNGWYLLRQVGDVIVKCPHWTVCLPDRPIEMPGEDGETLHLQRSLLRLNTDGTCGEAMKFRVAGAPPTAIRVRERYCTFRREGDTLRVRFEGESEDEHVDVRFGGVSGGITTYLDLRFRREQSYHYHLCPECTPDNPPVSGRLSAPPG